MENFIYNAPTKVLFGRDAELEAGREVRRFGGARVLLVYGGGSAVKSGLLGRIEGALDAEGLPHRALGGVQPNPRLELAQQGVREAMEFGADFILGIGGGSVLDTAKAIAIGAAHREADRLWGFWDGSLQPERALPMGAVTTIPAAGSETSNSAVLNNQALGLKRGLNVELNRPRFAILNPVLCATLPPYQVACGAADVLMHTLERYFVRPGQNELTGELAEGLMRTVVHNGPLAVANPADYGPMSELLWAGSVSHVGLTGLGTVPSGFPLHQLGHELSAEFDAAHGASLTAVWGGWARFVLEADPARFARYAEKVWGVSGPDTTAAALAGIEATEAWFASMGLPTGLGALCGVQPEETLQKLAERCTNYGKRKIGTFRVLEAPELYEIYRAANR